MSRHPSLLLFIVISLLSIALSYLTEQIILTREFFDSFFDDKLSAPPVEEIIAFRAKWRWVGFLIIPLVIFFKTFLISFCMWIGLFLRGLNASIETLSQVTLKAEVAHLASPLWTLIWFGVIHTNPDPLEVQNFYPLSLASALSLERAELWIRYPLSVLNIFELIYVLVLSFILSDTLDGDFGRYRVALAVVLSTYGAGLFFWILLAAFFFVSL